MKRSAASPPRGPVPEPSGALAAEALGEDPGQRGNKWWTLVAVCLGTFMLLLDITIVNVALPDIQRALHSSFSACSGLSTPSAARTAVSRSASGER